MECSECSLANAGWHLLSLSLGCPSGLCVFFLSNLENSKLLCVQKDSVYMMVPPILKRDTRVGFCWIQKPCIYHHYSLVRCSSAVFFFFFLSSQRWREKKKQNKLPLGFSFRMKKFHYHGESLAVVDLII